MKHHLIFDGAELAGKSWIMSQIYNYLEPRYNESRFVLDGCHWFNCDNAVFGTKYSSDVINNYLNIFKTLKNKNIIVEKFHIADSIYHQIHNNQNLDYKDIDSELNKLDFKHILICLPEDISKIKNRIKDRLNLYPHYKNILQSPNWYLEQQELYLKKIKKSSLPYLIVKTDTLPDEKIINDILKFIGESPHNT